MTKDEVIKFADTHRTGVLNVFARAHDWKAEEATDQWQWKLDHSLFDDYNRFRYCDKVPDYVAEYIKKQL